MKDNYSDPVESEQPPISLRHFVALLRAYSSVILLTLVAVAVGYAIFAVGILLSAPSQKITTQSFRLEFSGASMGQYPNGVRFATADIVSTPVLLQVYQNDDLERFLDFDSFSHALFILETNPAFERLVAEYQARLADVKLNPIDRDRIQKEYEQKAASLAKNEYSINLLRTKRSAKLPESMARKILVDVLSTWAQRAVKEHHVLSYELSMLSPDAFSSGVNAEADPIIALQVVRLKINRVLQNISELSAIPGADLLRTKKEKTSLLEIRMRFDELLRFRVEPLTALVRTSGMIGNPAVTISFLETQLSYDQRELKGLQENAEAFRRSLAAYSGDQRVLSSDTLAAAAASPSKTPQGQPGAGETVMPQLSDSFLDKLVTLTIQGSDAQYRQRLVEDFRRAEQLVIPVQMATAYDEQILNEVKTARGGSASPEALRNVQQQIASVVEDGRNLVGNINEIYTTVSENLNPARELYTLTEPPTTRTERARDVLKLMLWGVLLLLLSLPLIIIACLLHARLRDEEAEQLHDRTPQALPAR